MRYPTNEEISTLPDPVRRFIADLETRCDPAGELREREFLRQQVKGMETMMELLRARVRELDGDPDDV